MGCSATLYAATQLLGKVSKCCFKQSESFKKLKIFLNLKKIKYLKAVLPIRVPVVHNHNAFTWTQRKIARTVFMCYDVQQLWHTLSIIHKIKIMSNFKYSFLKKLFFLKKITLNAPMCVFSSKKLFNVEKVKTFIPEKIFLKINKIFRTTHFRMVFKSLA